jgi:hypothetical protein
VASQSGSPLEVELGNEVFLGEGQQLSGSSKVRVPVDKVDFHHGLLVVGVMHHLTKSSEPAAWRK